MVLTIHGHGKRVFIFIMGLLWTNYFLKIETKKQNSLNEFKKCFPQKQVPRYSVDVVLHIIRYKYLQIAFAKTHKTGSSTLQNIFFRFGERNNLNFALPENSWMFSYNQPFNASMVERLPWAWRGFDMFIFHRSDCLKPL